jgi:hypothetical protein
MGFGLRNDSMRAAARCHAALRRDWIERVVSSASTCPARAPGAGGCDRCVHIECLDGGGDLGQEHDKDLPFLLVEHGELMGMKTGHFGKVGVEDRVRRVGEFDEYDAPVGGAPDPAYEPRSLEGVD